MVEIDLQTVKDGKSSLHDEQRLLEEVQTRLALYNEQQAAALLLPQKIRDAAIEEEYLQRCIQNRAILATPSPMRTIPPEILSEIFVYYVYGCIPENVRVDKEVDFLADCKDIERAPNLLLTVCRRWYATAIAEPRLWAAVPPALCWASLVENGRTVMHRLASDEPQSRTFYWQQFHRRIARSVALPIDLLIFEYDSFNHIPDAEATSLYDAMLNLLPRARKVQFFVEFQESNELPVPVRIPSCLNDARLEGIEVAVLSVHGYGHGRPTAMLLGAQLLRRMIRIRHLTLSESTNTSCLWQGGLTNLTDLTMDAVDASLFFSIIQRASSLRNIRVRKIVPDILPSLSPFTHRELHRLDIQSGPYPFPTTETWEVLQGLTLPNLQILHVAPEIGHAWPSQEVVDFMLRSKCHLRELFIRDVPSTVVGDKLSEISESLKSLVLFDMTDISDHALLFLAEMGLLRNLQRLTVAVRREQVGVGLVTKLLRAYEMVWNPITSYKNVEYEVYIDAENEGDVGRYVKVVVRPYSANRYAIDLRVTYY
ncbi:hypothetical protein BDZ89DRAFT_1067004 [Hymenopellis radicata]|nr:hypothetical protein BDZ89DRAFT_1067004 [Hymenopellis radicata]